MTMNTNQVIRHVLPGIRPEPLASYLAGLGLIRVLGDQADPAATAAWTPDGLALTATVPDIAAWLADAYVPAPVVSPWTNGSGFGPRDKESRRVLDVLREHPAPRLAPFRDAIRVGEDVVRRARAEGWIAEAASGGDKGRVVQEFRNRCPDALLPWIDATVVLAGENMFFPPLLGTGGNDGRLDFSTNFHQRLLEVVGVPDGERKRSIARARDLLDGTEIEQLAMAAVGQFDPGSAGGPGSSWFGAADSLVNPWAYILLVEGALLFAAAAARRNQHYRQGYERAAIPFTVDGSPDGTDSGAAGEESRGEVWAPVWTAEFTLPEIRQLFAEARASWRGRPARRAVDFYAATRSLGVSRGIGQFTRYGLRRRNGLAFAAVPLDRITVHEKPEVCLSAGLEEWVARVGVGDKSSPIGEAVRRFESAHLTYARDGGPIQLGRMLATITTLEQAVGRSGRARENTYVRRPPRAQEFLAFLTAGHSSAELRIAVGLASCATLPGADPARAPSRTMRQILLPVDPPAPGERNRTGGRWRSAPVVPGFGFRSLPDVLADVLAWRSRTAAVEQDHQQRFRGVPAFRRGVPVPAADLHAFVSGLLDETALDMWLRACLALDRYPAKWNWPISEPFVPMATLGLLHPLAMGLASGAAGKPHRAMSAEAPGQSASREPGDEPKLALRPDWAGRLTAGQVRPVHEEAVARLRQAGWEAVPAAPCTMADGALIAAALVPRCRGANSILRRLAFPLGQSEEPARSGSTEPADPEEQS